MQAEPRVTLTVRVSSALYERVKLASDNGDLSMNEVVVRALEQALSGRESGDTPSVSSPRGSGFVKETAPTESSASVRAPAEKEPSEAKEPARREQAGPGSVPPVGGVRPAAPSRQAPSVARTWAR